MACGDLSGYDNTGFIKFLDADKSYPIEGTSDEKDSSSKYIKPIAPPIKPPYESSIAKAREEKQKAK